MKIKKSLKVLTAFFLPVFLAALFLAYPAHQAQAAIAQVQKASGKTSGASTTVSATWGSVTTAGNLLVAVIGLKNSSAITPPTVTGNAWTLAVRATSAADTNGQVASNAIYYIKNANSQSAGASTWTISSSQATLHLVEYSGMNTVSPLDVFASSTGTTSPTSSGTTATTSQANEVAVSGVNDSKGAASAGSAFTITSSGWTEQAEVGATTGTQNNRTDGAFDQKILSATGTQVATNTYNSGTSKNYASTIATFKETPTAPGIPDMTAATDTGSSSIDNITNDTTPNFTVSCLSGTTVTLYDNVTSVGTGACVASSVTITSSALSNGTHALMNAKQDNSVASSNLSITIDATVPVVSNVSSTLADGSYLNTSSQVVPVTVTFNEAVTVVGTPQLTLSTGSPSTTILNYTSGSPGTTLTFNYTVANNNYSFDLDYASTTALALNSGTIKDTAGNNATLTLASPGVAGSLGANKAIVITHPVPTISSADPSSVTRSPGGFLSLFIDINVYGTNFDNSSVVYDNGSPVATSFNNSTNLMATVPIGTAGVFPITVVNGAPGGGTSGSVDFTVNNHVPAISSISPDTKVTGSGSFTLTVNGSNIYNDSVIRFNGSDRSTTYTGGTSHNQTTATILAGDIVASGIYPITVFAPTPGGGLSNSANLTVTPLAPGVPNMTAGTDSGTFDTDNITNNSQPHFTVSCETGATVMIYDNTLHIATGTCVGSTVTVSDYISGGFSQGTHPSVNAKQQVGAGNLSSASSNLSITIDVTAPALAEVTPVSSPTNDPTPDYTFSSTEAGAITYGGDCDSSTPSASAGSNIITFNSLPDGAHTNCTIEVTDAAGNPSNTLAVSAFTVNTVPPATQFVIIDPTDDTVSNNITITVEARDATDAVVTDYQQDVTLIVDGSATGAGLVDIVNGVGTIDISDIVAETVTLTLSDTESTGLNVTATEDAVFSAGTLDHFIFDTIATPQTAGTPFDAVITAKDSFGNTVTSFSGTVDLTTTAGSISPTVSGSFIAGTITESVSVTQSGIGKTITAESGLEAGTSNSFTVQSDATTEFLLNDPGDMTVGTRVGYTTTREDQFDNLSTIGTETVYLYSTNPGTTDLFYDAAVDGNEITQIDIADGSSSALFWYYDDVDGSWDITASDNSLFPDNGAGIDDDTDGITVNIAPIVATKFIIEDPTDATVGDIVLVTIKAVDNANSVDTTYMNDVSIQTSGSATPAGSVVVDIINGVGTINITDTVAETVDLSLLDTEGTSLDVTSTQNLVFVPGTLDHFSYGPVASPQITGEAFNVNLTANDIYENTVTTFNGTVDLETTAGSITPNISDNFINGTRLESVTVTESGTGKNVTALRTGGTESGTSGNFNVNPGSLDNFLVEGAGGGNISTQTAGIPFDIKITARDSFNNILSAGPNTFNDTVEITSDGDMSAGDGATANFEDGVLLTHSVTIANTGLFSITTESGGQGGTSNSFTVSSAPIVATKFIVLDPSDTTVGGTITVTVKAVDNSNNVDSTYQTDVTLNVTGSATGAGLVSITNGVGTIDITDAVVETINLSLSDTQLTGLNVSSTQNATFSAIAVSSGGGHQPATAQSISSTGRTIPEGRITLFALSGTGVPLKQELTSSNGSYNLGIGSLLPGVQFYGLLITDKDGLISQAKIYQIDLADPSLFIEGFISSPTIGLLQSTITKGGFLTITGYVNSDATVLFEIDGKIIDERVTTDGSGSYKLEYSTANLSFGEHTVRTRQILTDGRQSEFSISKTFKISDLFVAASDFNKDGKVNVIDASVFLSNWLQPESKQAIEKIDFNKDGRVDIQDFSIFVNSLRL